MSNSPPETLFVYGTLMVPDVLNALLGRLPLHCEALLEGYRRYTIQGECYPAIVNNPGANVRGLLLSGLTKSDVETLDDYEGDAYVRAQVIVAVDGKPTQANCYVWRSQSDVRLGNEAWDLETFRTRHLADYLRALT
jgi:gamma-glutamylcyclotransferase (GGCT)/AIG2-like uncharacterized protein YtfP